MTLLSGGKASEETSPSRATASQAKARISKGR